MTPKEAGGLGFTDTKLTNECILSKWIFKLERGDRSICLDLLRKKYLGMHEAKGTWRRCIKHVVNNGEKTRFLNYVWCGECPLRISYHKLYNISHQQSWSVHQVLGTGEVYLTFRRYYGELEEIEWDELTDQLDGIILKSSARHCNLGPGEKSALYNFLSIPRNSVP
ncbi:hypothetical protein PVAP13_7NG306448, partial [Panicum virgatum]